MRKKKDLWSLVAYLRFKKKNPRIIMSVDKESLLQNNAFFSVASSFLSAEQIFPIACSEILVWKKIHLKIKQKQTTIWMPKELSFPMFSPF